MGTRSSIAVMNDDGTIYSAICHYDGSIDYCGKTLVKHYNNKDDALDLISSGGIINLRTNTFYTKYVCRGYLINKTHEDISSWIGDYTFTNYYYIFINEEWYVKTEINDNTELHIRLMSFKFDDDQKFYFVREYKNDGCYSNGIPLIWGD